MPYYSQYYKDGYDDLPEMAGGQDEYMDWDCVKKKGLKLAGSTGEVHGALFVNKQGMVFNENELKKMCGKNPDKDSSNNGDDNPNNYGNENFNPFNNPYEPQNTAPPSQPPVPQPPQLPQVANANPVLHSWQQVTYAQPVLNSSDPLAQLNKSKDEPIDCNRMKSYFYILSKNGGKPDLPANQFFNLMNSRAGDIFMLCPNGKVFLQEGKSPEGVITNSTVSKILALTINDAINGGKEYNKAVIKHKIKLLILPLGDPKCDITFIDDQRDLCVDLQDFNRLVENPRQGYNREGRNEQSLKKEMLQAGMIGHIICERDAEHLGLDPSHQKGVERECEIIYEMAKPEFAKSRKLIRSDWVIPAQDRRLFYYYDSKRVVPDLLKLGREADPPYILAEIYSQPGHFDDVIFCNFIISEKQH